MPILYYPLPIDGPFNLLAPDPGRQFTQVDGILTEIEQGPYGQWQIARIISTDPNDYLKPALQPGTAIKQV